ncbi:NINE protein [Caviibacter abscessus]|uniref:NINE protein n=1 Tax=Caviibacter abscessus TaxID=1766719 RepID=UPI0038B2EC98
MQQIRLYFSWIFLGLFGIHSFIAGKPLQGILFIIFTILGSLLSVIGIGFLIFSIEGLIVLIQIIMAACKKSDQYGTIR